IPFVEDGTNADTVYRRNLIRHKVLSPLREINDRIEQKATAMCAHLREDMQYLDQAAKAWYKENACGASVSIAAFLSLSASIARRVAVLLYEAAGGKQMLESVHTDALFASLSADKRTFVHRFPGDIFVYAEKDNLVFSAEPKKETQIPPRQEIHFGENELLGRHATLTLTQNPHYLQQLPSNVYKIAIKANLSSATIKGSLYVRARKEGDAYRYGSMTHSVKKLFSQKRLKGIPKEEIPILCDDAGILWVPGFSARQEEQKNENYQTWFAYYTYFGGENEQGH
ncbi:MAG: tRNA lysidine(34) synthetase TilS, partial [Clostridia bacterium]|nr:tRNA lysidine(34) synthetase TilS [Clostridia bacterium]